RAIVNVAPVNYGLASSLNIENSVQVDDELVLGLECVTYIDIYALPLYVVTYPHANDSYTPRTNDCLIAYSTGGVVDPIFHTPSLSVGSALQPPIACGNYVGKKSPMSDVDPLASRIQLSVPPVLINLSAQIAQVNYSYPVTV
ncbi:MAG: hypothetical protein EZS28_028694, partial [Streblomastix strix]